MTVHRVSVFLLALVLAAGQPLVCMGWMAPPDARMACCADDGTHWHGHTHEAADPDLTQAAADRCCVASDGGDSAPAPVSLTSSLTPAAVLTPLPALLLTPARPPALPASVPIPPAHVPKHLLLSVFLV